MQRSPEATATELLQPLHHKVATALNRLIKIMLNLFKNTCTLIDVYINLCMMFFSVPKGKEGFGVKVTTDMY